MHLLRSLGTLAADVQHGMQLLGLISEKVLQVADKAINIAFPSCLTDDILVIVVS